MRNSILLGTILLASFAGPASALNYLPLSVGTMSYFEGVTNPSNTLVYTVEENNGGIAIVSTVETGDNDWAAWFQFTEDPDGQAYLLAQSLDGGANWIPCADPIVWIDTPLFVGKTWSQDTFLGDDTYAIVSEVTAHEVITVPAGDFTTYCIVHEAVMAGIYNFTYIEWYAENVGLVKVDWTGFTLGDVYELIEAVIVGSESSSWGQVKSLYR